MRRNCAEVVEDFVLLVAYDKDEPRKKPARENQRLGAEEGVLSDSEESSKSSSVSPSKPTKRWSGKASSGKGNCGSDFKKGR